MTHCRLLLKNNCARNKRNRAKHNLKHEQQREQRVIKNEPVTQHASARLKNCIQTLQKLDEKQQVQLQP